MSGTQSFSLGKETRFAPHSFSSQLSPIISHSYVEQKKTNIAINGSGKCYFPWDYCIRGNKKKSLIIN